MEECKYVAIEELKIKHETPDSVFEGVKVAKGWKTGKVVTEDAYEEAVREFNKSPIDGREVKRDVE